VKNRLSVAADGTHRAITTPNFDVGGTDGTLPFNPSN